MNSEQLWGDQHWPSGYRNICWRRLEQIKIEIDIVRFYTLTSIRYKNPDKVISTFTKFNMAGAPKPLKIPHMTQIDGNHFVMGKVPNIYVPRT